MAKLSDLAVLGIFAFALYKLSKGLQGLGSAAAFESLIAQSERWVTTGGLTEPAAVPINPTKIMGTIELALGEAFEKGRMTTFAPSPTFQPQQYDVILPGDPGYTFFRDIKLVS